MAHQTTAPGVARPVRARRPVTRPLTHPDWDRAGADWPHRALSRFAATARTRWHVQRTGAGPVVVLLHGAGAASHSWRGLMPHLAARTEVIAPDLPGHGFSRSGSHTSLSLPGMARELGDLLAALEVRPAALIGHSAGAAIAVRAVLDGLIGPVPVIGLNAALTPFRGMAGLILPQMARALALNPFAPWMLSRMAGTREATRRLLAGTGSTIEPEGIALYARLLARPDHVSNTISMMAAWDPGPLEAALGRLESPLHLLTGDGDLAVPPHEAHRLAAAHPRITATGVPGLGHLMHEEDPGQIAGLIGDVLDAAGL